ncbi:acyl-CoA dehydrogenase family protein [Comamonas endophytica]|uniref:Acyl-CoA dehydrogenase family protein n=1 Tax=Comamonas endophytica TaxID=2949090 RepID=A0ABY6GDI2_9BURK|nr:MULTISPECIES: acyl-CoA dehydrogenase family protein [unclassified Acidovorax]MCD2512489.1 acyl-CoA dehydrogenase family protein [Acidovorax sp. D4N7]UYG53143.1 acyl-CoA dehydrogenase family protein [Acidovorax sp. 5MLIR]
MHAFATHEVSNQFDELTDFDPLATDAALQEAIARGGAGWCLPQLAQYAQRLGSAGSWALAAQANRHVPELQRFDARGRRIDQVEYHPSWHELQRLFRSQGLASLPFRDPRPGRWSAWAAGFYLHAQVEQGSLCPGTMTLASIPVLRKEPALWQQLQAGLYSDAYDPRDVPLAQKQSLWIGMGMTEKQGGSDVRSNTTQAVPLGAGASAGRGGEYLLRGHKWFLSAPMADAHLVVARLGEGGPPACFFVPRWRPDGSRNAVRLQRLKNKLGNRSNASSEVEYEDAWGLLLGEEGRGIATILEMAGHTRLNCVLGSAGILRSATVQALAYARRRMAFGKPLAAHPMMRAVLADLALESEAALALSMRLAQAFEEDDTPVQRAWKRIMTPAAKFWVCKRAVELSAEALEVFGGNGYVDDSLLARLLREAPVNSIWEGSGNVMCLDVLRAIAREPELARALLHDLLALGAGEPPLREAAQALAQQLQLPPAQLEGQGRLLAQRLVLLAQAGLLLHAAPRATAEAFIATRLGAQCGGWVVGTLDPANQDIDPILQRAFPG